MKEGGREERERKRNGVRREDQKKREGTRAECACMERTRARAPLDGACVLCSVVHWCCAVVCAGQRRGRRCGFQPRCSANWHLFWGDHRPPIFTHSLPLPRALSSCYCCWWPGRAWSAQDLPTCLACTTPPTLFLPVWIFHPWALKDPT